MAILYRGFSTIQRSKKFRLTDIDLVKRDLLNHFSVRKGERLMNPNFGTIVWAMLFEPLDDTTRQLILDDVTTIVNYDPRISLTNVTLVEQDQGILIQLDLVFLPTNQSTNMSLQFDADSASLTTTGVY
jgi:phage baseplate assembly protein W